MRKIALFLLISLSLSCRVRASESSQTKFLVLDKNESHFLMNDIFRSELRMCMAFMDIGEPLAAKTKRDIIENVSSHLKNSFNDWLSSLNTLTKEPLIRQFVVLTEADGCQYPKDLNQITQSELNIGLAELNVILNPKQAMGSATFVGHLHPQIRPLLFVGVKNFEERSQLEVQSTLLHETGHLFGLADTYFEVRMTRKLGQPDSAMYSRTPKLAEDDRNGMRWLFCRTFPQKNPQACEKLPSPGPVASQQPMCADTEFAVEDFDQNGIQGVRIVRADEKSPLRQRIGHVILGIVDHRVLNTNDFWSKMSLVTSDKTILYVNESPEKGLLAYNESLEARRGSSIYDSNWVGLNLKPCD